MKVDITTNEAELLIAVLTFSEGAALLLEPGIVEVLKDLRPWRSALLREYVCGRLNEAQVAAPEVRS